MATSTATRTRSKWKSRAVLRLIEPGSSVDCTVCGERVKFAARLRLQQVICNVYVDGSWSHIEHFHEACYETAGQPHGPAEAATPRISR